MKNKIMTEIQVKMAPFLSKTQNDELHRVLLYSFQNVDIVEQNTFDNLENIGNEKLHEVFIAAKKIEGCSEKSLKYYEATIQKMFAATNKPIIGIV